VKEGLTEGRGIDLQGTRAEGGRDHGPTFNLGGEGGTRIKGGGLISREWLLGYVKKTKKKKGKKRERCPRRLKGKKNKGGGIVNASEIVRGGGGVSQSKKS